MSLRDDQRFWMVEPGPPPWFGADGKPRIFAMRHQTMQARAIVQREELERRRLREVRDAFVFREGSSAPGAKPSATEFILAEVKHPGPKLLPFFPPASLPHSR